MMKTKILNNIKGKLIISCQAAKDEPLYNESAMNAMIQTVVTLGKINALRLAGKRDVKNTKKMFGENVTIIGITKPDVIPKNYKELVYITPDVANAKEIIEANADIVAFDCTKRNKNAKEIVDFIHSKEKLAMGDIASFEDAKYAYDIKCDIISTTLSGYTKETEHLPDTPDFELLKKCTEAFDVPIIMEGKIQTEKDVKHAFECGAYAVVIGSMVTRPHKIIENFKKGLL